MTDWKSYGLRVQLNCCDLVALFHKKVSKPFLIAMNYPFSLHFPVEYPLCEFDAEHLQFSSFAGICLKHEANAI